MHNDFDTGQRDNRDPVYGAWCLLPEHVRHYVIQSVRSDLQLGSRGLEADNPTQQWNVAFLGEVRAEVADMIVNAQWFAEGSKAKLAVQSWLKNRHDAENQDISEVETPLGRVPIFLDRTKEIAPFMRAPHHVSTMLLHGPCTFGKSALLAEVIRQRSSSNRGKPPRRVTISATESSTSDRIVDDIILGFGDSKLILETRNMQLGLRGHRLIGWLVENKSDHFIIGIDNTDRMSSAEQVRFLETFVAYVEAAIGNDERDRILLCVSGRNLGPAWKTAHSSKSNSDRFRFRHLSVNTLGAITPGSLFEDLLSHNLSSHSEDSLELLAARAYYSTGGNPSALRTILSAPEFMSGLSLTNREPLSTELTTRILEPLSRLAQSTPEDISRILRIICLMPRCVFYLLKPICSDPTLNPGGLTPHKLKDRLVELGFVPEEQPEDSLLYTSVGSSFFTWHRLSRSLGAVDIGRVATMYDELLSTYGVNGDFAANLVADRILSSVWIGYASKHLELRREPNSVERSELRNSVVNDLVPSVLSAYMSQRSIEERFDFSEDALTRISDKIKSRSTSQFSAFRIMVDYFLCHDSQQESATKEISKAIDTAVNRWLARDVEAA